MLSFLNKPYNEKYNIPSSLIIRFIDPIIILKDILNNLSSMKEQMNIIIRYLKICDNLHIMDDPLFFINIGMNSIPYRIYMKPILSILSGEVFSQKLFAYFVDKKDIDNMIWMNYYCYQYNYTFEDGSIIDNETSNSLPRTIWTIKVFEIVLIKKDFVIFKWLVDNIYDDYNDSFLELLIKNGNLKFLEYLLLKKFPIKYNPLIIAIKYEQLGAFDLLVRNEFIVDNEIVNIVITYGKLEILKSIYCINKELILTNIKDYSNYVIKYDYLHIYNWLKTII
jgi:hypothetical protein